MRETADILIENATILTLDDQRRILTDGAIAIRGDRILAADKTAALRKAYRAIRTVGASLKLVIPGLIDGHAHLIELARGLIPDNLRTGDWLKDWWYPYLKAITGEEVVEMATLEGQGAKATGWEDDLGALVPGRKADMILIDTDRPEWAPSYNLVYSLVYSATGDSVDTVIVDGKILMENRELTTMDLAEVHANCRTLASKLIERANIRPISRWPVV